MQHLFGIQITNQTAREDRSVFVFLFPLQVLRTVDANEMILTAVAMSHSGRMLFAGTSTGTLRSMKFPLTVPGEWTEYQGHGSAILKVNLPTVDFMKILQ